MKLQKISAAIFSAALMTGLFSPASGVFAASEEGNWRKSGDLYWFEKTDGTWPENEWAFIQQQWYHFNENGFMQTGWKKFGGNWYYLGEKNDGAMKTGWIKNNGLWYYLDSSGKMLTGWKTIDNKSYYFWSNGHMARNTTVDGYTIGDDGVWVPENTKPTTPSQTPAVSIDEQWIPYIQQTINQIKEMAESNGIEYYSYPVYTLIDYLKTNLYTNFDVDKTNNFINTAVTFEYQAPNGYTYHWPTEQFMNCLSALGYDYNKNCEEFSKNQLNLADGFKTMFDEEQVKALYASNLYNSGLKFNDLKPLIETLIKENCLSSDFMETAPAAIR